MSKLNTKFPFYDLLYNLVEPYLPLIVNDLSPTALIEVLEEDGYTDEDFLRIEELDDDEEEIEVSEEDIDGMIALSFTSGNFSESEKDEHNYSYHDCDFEMVVQPFFTYKPYLLIGVHNYQTKQFYGEVYDSSPFQPIELLEKFADIIQKVFPTEPLENKIFLMSTLSQTAIQELTLFDQPTYVRGQRGEVYETASPYYDLDNGRLHEYFIKEKHFK